MMFSRHQLEQSLKDLDLIFLPKEPAATFGMTPGPVSDVLMQGFNEQFEKVAEGAYLVAWRRTKDLPADAAPSDTSN